MGFTNSQYTNGTDLHTTEDCVILVTDSFVFLLHKLVSWNSFTLCPRPLFFYSSKDILKWLEQTGESSDLES